MTATTLAEALALFGLEAHVRDPAVIRQAYLRTIRETHPDRNRAADATRRSAALTDAYRLVTSRLDEPVAGPEDSPAAASRNTGRTTSRTTSSSTSSATSAPPRPSASETHEIDGWVRIIADDTIELGAPSDLAFRWLELASHRAGDITYLDRPSAMLQVLMEFVGYPLCYVVFDLQGRAANGSTEVFCTIASLDDRDPPPIAAVTEFMAAQLDDVLD